MLEGNLSELLATHPAGTGTGEGEFVPDNLSRLWDSVKLGLAVHLSAICVQVWPNTSISTTFSWRITFSYFYLLDKLSPCLRPVDVDDEEYPPHVVRGSSGPGPVLSHATHRLTLQRVYHLPWETPLGCSFYSFGIQYPVWIVRRILAELFPIFTDCSQVLLSVLWERILTW